MNARAQSPRHVQTQVPAPVHKALADLSYDTGRSIANLAFDGVLLVLRFHARGAGLPEPMLPLASQDPTGDRS